MIFNFDTTTWHNHFLENKIDVKVDFDSILLLLLLLLLLLGMLVNRLYTQTKTNIKQRYTMQQLKKRLCTRYGKRSIKLLKCR
jgi:hypothetical protein